MEDILFSEFLINMRYPSRLDKRVHHLQGNSWRTASCLFSYATFEQAYVVSTKTSEKKWVIRIDHQDVRPSCIGLTGDGGLFQKGGLSDTSLQGRTNCICKLVFCKQNDDKCNLNSPIEKPIIYSSDGNTYKHISFNSSSSYLTCVTF